MTHKDTKTGKYWNRDSINSETLGYVNTIPELYKECQEMSELHGVPLEEFRITTGPDYDSERWVVEYDRPSTKEEIEIYEAEQDRYKAQRRKEFERMKKEFE